MAVRPVLLRLYSIRWTLSRYGSIERNGNCYHILTFFQFDSLNKGSDENGIPYKNALDVILRQYRKGLGGFYAGVQVTLRKNAQVPISMRRRSLIFA